MRTEARNINKIFLRVNGKNTYMWIFLMVVEYLYVIASMLYDVLVKILKKYKCINMGCVCNFV